MDEILILRPRHRTGDTAYCCSLNTMYLKFIKMWLNKTFYSIISKIYLHI